MKKVSEKLLNLSILKSLTDPELNIKDHEGKIQNGTVFYTSFGIVVGGLNDIKKGEIDLSEIFINEKNKAINSFGKDSFYDNGEIICVKNATIIHSNSHIVYNDCLFIHIESINAFSLCNVEEAKLEISKLKE